MLRAPFGQALCVNAEAARAEAILRFEGSDAGHRLMREAMLEIGLALEHTYTDRLRLRVRVVCQRISLISLPAVFSPLKRGNRSVIVTECSGDTRQRQRLSHRRQGKRDAKAVS